MDDAERKAKMEEMLEEERAKGQYGWWWLSFAEPRPPEGRGFLGAVLVQANGFGSAVIKAGLQHLNPGGEERVKSVVTLFERACDRSVKVGEALAKLNIDERLMRIEEAKVAFVIAAIEAALEDAGIDVEHRERVRIAIDGRLRGPVRASVAATSHPA